MYQKQEAMLKVFVGLDAAILWALVVQRPCGVKEGNVSISAGAEVNLLQLQLVGCVQVLLRVPQHPTIQRLTCRGQQRSIFVIRTSYQVAPTSRYVYKCAQKYLSLCYKHKLSQPS